jgi:AcrR family transcriptional regulator
VPRAGLSRQIVVEEAARLADEVGFDRLTLALLAKRLGVALPSLYKHIRGIDALREHLSALATTELAEVFSAAAAGRARADAVRAVADAYRDYARQHPGRYAATQLAPHPDDADHLAAAARAVDTIYAVLEGYGLSGDDALDATRVLRCALHGFVLLENGRGFGLPREVDRSFDQLVATLDIAFSHWPSP